MSNGDVIERSTAVTAFRRKAALSPIAAVAVQIVVLILSWPLPVSGQTASTHGKTYPLRPWIATGCRFKGRFQDGGYCQSAVIDQIVADGKPAIPILISQITDSRWIAERVYDFWPAIRTGELAHFILSDLFRDDTWQRSTMPDLFPAKSGDTPGWVWWEEFRKTHSLADIQARWMKFWKANQDEIYWDPKARCFRLSDRKTESDKH
jgi:hypothetical protein